MISSSQGAITLRHSDRLEQCRSAHDDELLLSDSERAERLRIKLP